MNDSDNGFSFGVRDDGPGAGAPFDDDGGIDAIEVGGEPISRSEARKMGHAAATAIVAADRVPPQRKSSREEKSASTLLRLDQLPKDLSGELTEKLEAAWNHLARNEIGEALTLAQEVVWEYPALVAPKLIIARCFINRKEYDKALKLLQAIGDSDMNSETLYYIGLCQSRLGRIGEAMEALKLARASSTDAETRKRAGDLMQHLQGEQIVCPVCGKKVLYDSMVDVGNQTVCANCAKNMEEEDEEDDDEEDEDDGSRRGRTRGGRKKRLRPPLTRADVLMRFAAAGSFLALGWIILYILSLAAPGTYASVRRYIPDWSRLPAAEGNFAAPSAVSSAPQLLQSVTMDSPPLRRAIAGVELRHHVFIESPENRQWTYSFSFYPEPAGEFGMDEATGQFHWTPDDADVGKTFEITFSAAQRNLRARDQINQVAVSPGPRFGNIVNWTEPRPGEARQMAAGDLDADGEQELVLSSGAFWEGEIAVFDITDANPLQADRERQRIAAASIPGRPVGIGVILADGEPWIAVADYWNSRLRYYAIRGGSLSEMAVDVDLPSRPILTAFDTASSTSAVLCRNEDANHLLVYRQVSQLDSVLMGDWSVPDDFVWRRILILPKPVSAPKGAAEGTSEPAARYLLFGGDAAESVYLADSGDEAPVKLELGVRGTLVDAASDGDGEVFCLIQNESGLQLYRFTLNEKRQPVLVGPVSAGEEPALGGFAVLPAESGGSAVAFALSTTSLGLSIASSGAGGASLHFWPLPRPARLLGPAAVVPGGTKNAPRVAYFDDAGGVWAIDISVPDRGNRAAGGEEAR